MSLINCPECSKEISDKVKACPHCGFPMLEENQSPQQVEVTAVSIKSKNPLRIKKILIGIALILVAVVGISSFLFIQNKNKEKEIKNEYIDNLSIISTTMLLGAGDSETLCNLTAKVWRNTIYKEFDTETDKYTRGTYVFHDDFNTSLANLFSDTSTIKKIDSIKSNKTLVTSIMKDLKNPPIGFEKCYDTLTELYSTYQGLTDLAISPSGSLTTFIDNKNDKTNKFLDYYKRLNTQIPDKDD